ncbi:MAG: dephospho-CoA kinase [Gemmatimonadetes bacterium]|nr:dephospho-CoA kinase [Gemmatimonadota bacterium]MXY83372.1 dephospho-CoA kinase [Gemmatimonadota bacterium]MYB67121.1 dephospho-CoA kinase [Gemmatimonadota bacterium]
MLVGITGGMGAGKSALAQMLAELGALRVDADEVAREVATIPAVIENLQAAFGRDLLGPDGRLDRRELGRRALRSDEVSQQLEAIMRPPLSAAIERRLAQAVEEAAGGVVVFDAPLIYEWENEGNFDRIVVVDAEEERCVSRVQQRSGLPVCEIRQRMARQMNPQEKKARANFVIDNNKGLDALAAQAKTLWAELVSAAQGRGNYDK